jgi:hypothetical protein
MIRRCRRLPGWDRNDGFHRQLKFVVKSRIDSGVAEALAHEECRHQRDEEFGVHGLAAGPSPVDSSDTDMARSAAAFLTN